MILELSNIGGNKGPEKLTLVPTALTGWEGHDGRVHLEGWHPESAQD